jgi:hypothetical protein
LKTNKVFLNEILCQLLDPVITVYLYNCDCTFKDLVTFQTKKYDPGWSADKEGHYYGQRNYNKQTKIISFFRTKFTAPPARTIPVRVDIW